VSAQTKGHAGVDDVAREPREWLELVLAEAKARGATAADAMFVDGSSTEVRVRMGETEQVKQSRGKGVGLRVFVGDRSATTSSSDLDERRLRELVGHTCDAARLIAADPFSGLPDASVAAEPPVGDLDLFDESLAGFAVDEAVALARRAEDAARGADARITNSEGAEMSWGTSELHMLDSRGLYRTRRSGSASLSTTPVAEADGAMQRDYWYTHARHLSDLEQPEAVGLEAARRTLRRLGARKPDTCQVPIIFEASVASRLLGSIASAVNGASIYRKSSWLQSAMGTQIAAAEVCIDDDPCVVRGAGSRAFDGEGLATRRLSVVEAGVLRSWLLDSYTARKLGLETTRHARRGLGGSPSPGASNFRMANGSETLEALIAGTKRGIFVTELFGFGVNGVTGDYSQGAAGVFIDGGALAYPVHEFTIASTLQAMWLSIDAIANDRHPSRACSAPSFRVASMTVAGS
jgi:PmbA protein